MASPGHDASHVLPDGRIIEYWEGGDAYGEGVIYHPGTPSTHVMGRWGHDAAVAAGVRLVSVSRPGYGGSTTLHTASLLAVGRDTAALATHLRLDRYAVFGCSGGGPFAVATAITDPDNVRALGVVGGIGPWRLLDDPSSLPEEREVLALLDAGDLAGAWQGTRGQWEGEFGSFATPDDAVDDIIAGDAAAFAGAEGYRALWRENMRLVLANVDGGVRDNLAWGGAWDVDLRDVVAPTLLWFGEDDDRCPLLYGRWYADRIPGSELIVLPTGGHIDVVDGHWPEVLARLLQLGR
jgi:pimeloyl-ACP methyl ester carboxylesterase